MVHWVRSPPPPADFSTAKVCNFFTFAFRGEQNSKNSATASVQRSTASQIDHPHAPDRKALTKEHNWVVDLSRGQGNGVTEKRSERLHRVRGQRQLRVKGYFPMVQTAGGALPALSASGGTNSLVSMDAMQEFRIQTSSFARELGRTPVLAQREMEKARSPLE
jgi:hypothetical protein